ncbi:hypothetical protein B0H14DRAFT_3876886 [Mycena olivaceomarginata]|nr:hypothetical protein B0H14DRAFT_3876886 [Mycena olivaceomarginata]
MACLPPLPLDLLHPIVSHIGEKSTLLQLCHVSKSFLREAQSQLFADVALRSPAVSTFCCTISVSPTLALSVQRLSVQLANEFADMDALARALRSLPNLRALEITPPQPDPWAKQLLFRMPESMGSTWTHAAAAHILHDVPFRLRVFGSSFGFREPALLTFLHEQHEIEELAALGMGMGGEVVKLPGGMLPRLKKFRSVMTHLVFEIEVGLPGGAAPESGVRSFRQERMDLKVLMAEVGYCLHVPGIESEYTSRS